MNAAAGDLVEKQRVIRLDQSPAKQLENQCATQQEEKTPISEDYYGGGGIFGWYFMEGPEFGDAARGNGLTF